MKMPLLIALTCPSLAFDDRGNDFSNGASDSGGYSFQSLLEGSVNTANLGHWRKLIEG